MSELARLQNEIDELRNIVEELARQDRPQWHFETLTNVTDWFGASKIGTSDNGVIDLSTDFGVPAKVRAVLIRTDVRDNTITAVKLGDSSGGSDYFAYTGYGNNYDEWIINQGVVPCDENGDIWLTIDPDNVTITMSLFILAYYI